MPPDTVILIISRDQAIRVPWEAGLRDGYKLSLREDLPPATELAGMRPQLVILDALLLDTEEDLLARCVRSGCKVLVLGSSLPEQRQISVYAQGASGYCEKTAPPAIAHKAVETILKGDVWIQRDLVSKLIGTLVKRNVPAAAPTIKHQKDPEALKSLSSREKEVVERIRIGESNRQIAEHLFISERTVKAHLSSIFKKLHLTDRLQLVIYLQQLEAHPD